MSSERWEAVRRIFAAALDRPIAERAAYVDEACAGDPALRREVEGLLHSHEEAGDFLESPASLAPDAAPGRVQAPTLAPGRRLGPYEVLELLDAGGMGEVYRARDTRLHRDVALKVMRPHLSTDPRRLRQFESEARAAGAISDPNILAVFDVGNEDGVPYVISELLEGKTLGQRLRRGALGRQESVTYAMQIAEGLAAAHDKGIIHRDLKPDNVFVTTRGHVKILDFGIAKLLADHGEEDAGAEFRGAEARQSALIGTPGYIAPEQLEGRPVDHRVDIFALGAVLYRMLTGRAAFGPESTTAELAATLRGEPRPIPPESAVPKELERVVLRCLEKRPEDRFQSAAEVRAALQQFSADAGGRRGRRWTWAAAASLIAAVAAVVFVDRRAPDGPGAPLPIRSLAVLPLRATAGGPEQDYFVDGMTDALIAEIARTRSFRVISRASVMPFKDGRTPVPEIARQLGVDAVVQGTVQRLGDDVRLALRLTRAGTGEALWAGTYEGLAGEMPALQRKVAGVLAQEVAHGGPAPSAAPRHAPASAETYDAYLRGRYYWNIRTADAVARAIAQFNRALALDPLYAPAYSGLADAFATFGDMLYVMPSQDAFAKAEAATLRALELDPSQAEAHATLAHLRMHALRWDDAEREFQRAIDLNPGYAPAYQWRAYNLAALGRMPEAVAAAQRAVVLDPLSLIINADLAQILFFAGRVDEAIAQSRKTIQMNPDFAEAHRILFLALIRKGQHEEALRELDGYYRHPDGGPGASVGYGYAMLGKRARALAVLDELQKKSRKKFEPPYSLGVIHAALGNVDRAFAYLDESVATNDVETLILPADPRLLPLHGDPRFAALRQRMGLPPAIASPPPR